MVHSYVNSTQNKVVEQALTDSLKELIIEKCIRKEDGVFHLTSGEARQIYFDLKQITLNHKHMDLIANELRKLLMANGISIMDIQSIGGLEYGAIPIATHMAYLLGVHAFYIKKARKNHALRNVIEGRVLEPYVLVDDVVTTGLSMNTAESTLQNEGFKKCIAKICVIDRRHSVYEDRNNVISIFIEDEILNDNSG